MDRSEVQKKAAEVTWMSVKGILVPMTELTTDELCRALRNPFLVMDVRSGRPDILLRQSIVREAVFMEVERRLRECAT